MKVAQARQGAVSQLSFDLAEQMKREEQRLRELLKQLKKLNPGSG